MDASTPERVVIATEAGLFVSDDNGETWRSTGPPVGVRALAQSVADPLLWLAGTAGHGALLSSDGGETWTPSGDARSTLYAVAFAGHDPTHMAVGGYRSGVHLSTDGGSSWRTSSLGEPGSIHALAFDPHRPGRLWIGTVGDGVFIHDGDGWQHAGLPETTVTAFAFS
jgi:photosystem II stability/assembly factor-like uncharacterized protein